jgi:hypothetical protein
MPHQPITRFRTLAAVATIALSVVSSSASASVTHYSGLDQFDAWSSAAGEVTTIDFTGLPQNTFITDQYVDQGVLFTSSDPDVVLFGPGAFLLDGVGLNGVHVVELTMLAPTTAFAYHHIGWHYLKLYSGNTLLYTSTALGFPGNFSFNGFVSSTPFDRLVLLPYSNPEAVVYIDNLYLSTIPAPGVAGPLALSGLLAGSRRRAGTRKLR